MVNTIKQTVSHKAKHQVRRAVHKTVWPTFMALSFSWVTFWSGNTEALGVKSSFVEVLGVYELSNTEVKT